MTPRIPTGAGRRALAAAGPVVVPAALFLVAALVLPAVAGNSAIGAGLAGAVAGALAIAMVGAATAMPSRWLRPGLALAAILGVGAHVVLLANSGLPWGYDTLHHLWGLSAYGSELQAGNWLPLWLHRIGLGMPLPVFYSPLVFWAATAPLLLGLGPGLTLKLLLLGAGGAAAAGAFGVARRVTGDGAAALVGAAAVAFAPYRLLDAHYRVALPETAAFALLPLALYLCWRYLEAGGSRRLAAAAATLALLALTHALSALMVAVGLGTMSPALLVRARRLPEWSRLARRSAALGGLGVLLAACFLLPVAADLPSTWEGTRADADIADRYAHAGLEAGDFLIRRSWGQLQFPRSREVDQPMPFYFGIVLLALLMPGAIRAVAEARSPKRTDAAAGAAVPKPGPLAADPDSRATLPWAALAVVALLLAWAPVARATATLPLLGSLQFPWRFLAIASCAAGLSGAIGARWLSTVLPRWRRWIPVVLVAFLVADAQPMTGASTWLNAYRGFGWYRLPDRSESRPTLQFHAYERQPPLRVAGAFLPFEGGVQGDRDAKHSVGLVDGIYPEWATLTVRRRAMVRTVDAAALAEVGVGLWMPAGAPEPNVLTPRPYAAWLRPERPAMPPRACDFERGSGRIRVTTPSRKGTVVVLEQCFPGWQVRTPRGWRPAACNRDGNLEATVRRGQTEVEFRFRRWTGARTAGWLATGFGIAVAAALWRRDSG